MVDSRMDELMCTIQVDRRICQNITIAAVREHSRTQVNTRATSLLLCFTDVDSKTRPSLSGAGPFPGIELLLRLS